MMRARTLWGLLLTMPAAAFAQSTSPLNLDQVVAQALKVDQGVAAAQLHVQEARSHLNEVAGQKRFQLTFDGLLSESTGKVAEPPALQTFGTAQAALTWNIPNLGRANAQIDQARADLDAANAALRATELDVEFQVRQAYIEVLRSRDEQEIAQGNLDQANQQASDTQKRIDAGDLPPADFLKAQVPVAQNKAALARAKIAVSVAQQNLNSLLHRSLAEPLDLASPEPPKPVMLTADQAVALALKQSPDVIQAEASARSAEANVRSTRRNRDPSWSLQATHVRTTDFTADSHLSSLALNFSYPLIDAGITKLQVRQASLQLGQAQAALEQARQQVAIDVQQALLEVQGDEANMEATGDTLQIAGESLTKARQSYDAGLTTTRDVLDAQLVFAQAKVEANGAVYDLQVALARLRQILGGDVSGQL